MPNPVMQALKNFNYERYAALIALAILFIISSILSPYFLQLQNILNVLRQVSYTGIAGLGMTFVIISAGIDLSVGSLLAFSAAAGILVLNPVLDAVQFEIIAVLVGIGISLGVAVASGTLNGFLISRGGIAPFIVTLGGMAIFRSLALFVGNAGEVRSNSLMFGSFGMNSVVGLPVPVFAMLALAVILHFILNNTRYGRYLCAVGSNAKVATFSAINVGRIKVVTYALNGLMVGIASVMLASRFNAVSTSNTGMQFELDVIASVIIGGTPMTGGRGTVWGTIIGAIILGIINNMMNMLGVSPYLQGTVKGLVIVGAVYIQRQRS